jgi:hypothetical protein
MILSSSQANIKNSKSLMQMNNVMMNAAPKQAFNSKPTIPLPVRQPMVERKISDPSSSSPKGERYPIPSFFEYRIKPRDYDPL